MKVSIQIMLLSVWLAIVAVQSFHTMPSWRINRASSSSLQMKLDNSKTVMRTLKTLAGVLAVGGGLGLAPVQAANYGGFGSSYSEVINPKDAVLNDETKGSADVKEGKESLAALINTVAAIKSDLTQNPQLDLPQRIKQDLPISKIRNALNKYNAAFSEDTQRGTDRLIRNVLQEITDLQRESLVKPGKQRSPSKLNTAVKTLSATESALKDLAAFYP